MGGGKTLLRVHRGRFSGGPLFKSGGLLSVVTGSLYADLLSSLLKSRGHKLGRSTLGSVVPRLYSLGVLRRNLKVDFL